MSMQTDVVYGYGFYVYVSDEELKSFVLKHKDTILKLDRGREVLEYTKRCSDDEFNPKEDFYDLSCDTNGNQGFYSIIANTMSAETGIRFDYCRAQEDDDDAILFAEGYPWHLNKIEMTLTKEKLEEICNKYITDLGGQLKPEHIRLEYFG